MWAEDGTECIYRLGIGKRLIDFQGILMKADRVLRQTPITAAGQSVISNSPALGVVLAYTEWNSLMPPAFKFVELSENNLQSEISTIHVAVIIISLLNSFYVLEKFQLVPVEIPSILISQY